MSVRLENLGQPLRMIRALGMKRIQWDVPTDSGGKNGTHNGTLYGGFHKLGYPQWWLMMVDIWLIMIVMMVDDGWYMVNGLLNGLSIVMGVPQCLDGLFHGKFHLQMDDDWGYPYFRKPPSVDDLCTVVVKNSKNLKIWREISPNSMSFNHCFHGIVESRTTSSFEILTHIPI